MTLLEATRQEADILEALAVEHFYDKFEYLIVELSYVQIIIWLPCQLVAHRTLSKSLRTNHIIGFTVVFGDLLGIQTEQANVNLVLAAVKSLPHLVQKVLFVAAVRYFELCAAWQHGFFLEH